jgi:hypothetical protein
MPTLAIWTTGAGHFLPCALHHAVDRLWVEPMSGFSDNPIARPIRELEFCLVIKLQQVIDMNGDNKYHG